MQRNVSCCLAYMLLLFMAMLAVSFNWAWFGKMFFIAER